MIKLEELTYNDEVVLTIGLDPNDQSVIMVDKHNNTIRMGTNGISFESPKDVCFKAAGHVNVEATSAIGLASKSDIKIEGLNIGVNARVGLTAKGNATAEFSAAGQTFVKGGFVMIN